MRAPLMAAGLLLSSHAFADSGLKYWYSELKSDFEYYTGTRTKNAKLKVHEFSLNDSSGAFSAALQTTGNRLVEFPGFRRVFS